MLSTYAVSHRRACQICKTAFALLLIAGKQLNCLMVGLSDTLYHCFSLVTYSAWKVKDKLALISHYLKLLRCMLLLSLISSGQKFAPHIRCYTSRRWPALARIPASTKWRKQFTSTQFTSNNGYSHPIMCHGRSVHALGPARCTHSSCGCADKGAPRLVS